MTANILLYVFMFTDIPLPLAGGSCITNFLRQDEDAYSGES